MAQLFSPLKIRSLTLKNRIMVSPMCEYSSEDGFANDWHLVHLGSRAVGGAALVVTEACAVSPEARISPEDLGIWKDEHIPRLKSIVEFLHQQGALAGIQLAHAGRKASHASPWKGNQQIPRSQEGWEAVAPSSIAFREGTEAPAALTQTGIEQVKSDFKNAAVRALKAGFDLIELHAAHGYLMHEFLSPLTNQRKDQYGGCFENRIRFVLEITEEVRKVWPGQKPLFIRISGTDWAPGGWSLEESTELVKILKNKEVDLVDCSSGGLVTHATIPVGPGYQVPIAAHIKKETGMLTGAVGMILSATQAETILVSGQADLIIMARELLRDPYFALHAAQELGEDIPWPVQYERAKPKK
ncbi:MAG: NADH:flavin oxidoreductase/NADH oxidase [Chitinophagaceae bacterium]